MSSQPLDEIKGFAKNTRPEDFRNGAWFGKLIEFALRTYQKEVTAEYFREKYPGLPPDAVVDLRIALAKKNAALSGGVTNAAYAAAVVATIGTAGGASPLTVPAAIVSIGTDLSLASLIQLRLAYDISVLYGHPLDYEDPEELSDLLNLAFGVEVGDVFNKSIQRMAPEATRVFIKRTATGSTLQWMQALPVVGRFLLQRNIIKVVIPVVGIGLGYGLNFYVTGKIGKRARAIFRKWVAIEEFVREFPLEKVQDVCLLLDLIWLTVYVDKTTSRGEAWLLREFVSRIQQNGNIPGLEEFSQRVNFDQTKILAKLSSCGSEEREALFEAVCNTAVIDGLPGHEELTFVRAVAQQADVILDEKVLQSLAKKYKHGYH